MKSIIKDIIVGLGLFTLPFLFFFKDTNLRQFTINEIYTYLLTYLIIFLFLILVYFVVIFFLKFLFKVNINFFFTNIIIVFLSFFFFNFFIKVLVNLKIVSGTSIDSFALILVFILIIINLYVFNYHLIKYKIFFRILTFYILINVISNLYFNFKYLNEINFFQNIEINNYLNYQNKRANSSEKNIKNIYFVILDGMISLENFSTYFDYETNLFIDRLEKQNLNYINKSYSNYATTYLTLSSIFLIDFPIDEKSTKYNNRDNFFPNFLLKNPLKIPLINILQKENIDFYWVGNIWMRCLDEQKYPWICLNKNTSYYFSILENISNTVLQSTPFYKVKNYLFEKREYLKSSQRSLYNFINYTQNFGLDKKNKFVFIHHLSPHQPYEVDSNCNSKKYTDVYLGYKNSYLCVLKEIENFTKYINTIDKDPIIIFQADHGQLPQSIFSNYNLSKKDLINLKSSIFNLIYAPEDCFAKYSKPKSNINSVIFGLNCAYDYNINYKEDVFYDSFYENSPKYGLVEGYKHENIININ